MEFDLNNISSEHIAAALETNKDRGETITQNPEHIAQAAAVLVPLVIVNGLWHFLFTKRSQSVNEHKGQVSFPGGRIEPADENHVFTALREANEEIGLKTSSVNVLGSLKGFTTASNIWVIPVVGELKWPTEISLSKDEVSKVFMVPISWFLEKCNIETKEFLEPNGVIRKVIYYREFESELVWGITAKIIFDFLIIINE